MKVPKRRPPRPHSCSRSRSPLRQWAAAKPSQVMNRKRMTNTVSATQLMLIASPRFLVDALLLVGREIHDRGEDRGDDHPKHLVPVKERDAGEGRLHAVEEGRPENGDELHDEEQ